MSLRIAITGAGLVTPLGTGAAAHTARVLRGESGIGPLPFADAAAYACRAAGAAGGFTLDENSLRFPKNARYYNAQTRFALGAAREALAQAGLPPGGLEPERCGIYTAGGQTGVEYEDFFGCLGFAWQGGRELDYKYAGGRASHLMDRYASVRTLSNLGVACLSTELDFRGTNGNYVQSDAAALQAVAAACQDLAEGRCDAAVAGGYDSLLKPSVVLAYERAGLLSHADPGEAYRPFDRDRDGLAPGEGAGFLLLERREDAERRGAAILGEITGTGFAAETADAAFPQWERETVERAVAAAGAGAPDFVVAHGIGTRDGDRREAAALAALFGRRPVTALKSHTGYLGAATGAVELATAVLCARQGCLPPMARHSAADPDCALDLVTRAARPLPGPAGLLVAASWGGQYGAVAFRTA